MSEVPNKPSESKEKPAVSAVVRARDMLCELSGPRGWHDTRESWLARGARRARLSMRRARAIFYQEPIRLTADEYIAIEAAFRENGERLETAHEALAEVSGLARDARLGPIDTASHGVGTGAGEGPSLAGPQRPGTVPAAR